MTIAEYIDAKRKSQGKTKIWVAEQCNMNYKTFVGKIINNNFSANELVTVAKVLNLDLNKMKEEIDS